MKSNCQRTSPICLLAVMFGVACTNLRAQVETPPSQWPSFVLADAETAASSGSSADDEKAEEAELAKKLQNPVASLISVPIQNNWDFGIGPQNGTKYTVNIQPVVPISISQDWNLIVRTIVPVNTQTPRFNGDGDHAGLGDITQSFFFSPKTPIHGWILGAGPVMLYPTASDPIFGSQQWGAGPTAVALRQEHGFTYGVLANHLWNYTGWGQQNVNATFLQPFVAYTTKTYTTFGVNTETTYNWQANQWSVPLNFTIQQLVKIGKQPIALQFGYRYYASSPTGGPTWGLRFAVTFLFPKK